MSTDGSAARPMGPAVLIGSKPADGYQTFDRLGIPYIWVVDPVDGPPPTAEAVVRTMHAPFKSDPTSVLSLPLPRDVCGVFSFTEMGGLPAAMLSEAWGLPTAPVRAVLRARDKLVMRRLLAARGDGPDFGVVGTDEPQPQDFPLVVKPTDGTGSQGVEYVADPAAFARRRGDLDGALWETYLVGDEYSVEAVSSGGSHRILGITAKRTTGKPFFVETGHLVPAALTPEQEHAVRGCATRCLDALEIVTGASHTEVMLAGERAVVIETHTRPGGDRIPLLTRLVGGADQYELAVKSVLPWASVQEPAPRFAHAAVHYFPWQGVTVEVIDGLESSREIDGVVEVDLQVAEGDAVPLWRYSHERPGHVVVGADDADELRRRITQVTQTLRAQLR